MILFSKGSASSRHAYLSRIFFILLLVIGTFFTSACDEETLPPPTLDLEAPVLPIDQTSLKQSPLGDGAGHWGREIRAVSIDEEDYVAASSAKEEIEASFSTLVLNVPLIDKRTGEECLSGTRGQDALPANSVSELLNKIKNDRGLSFDRVIVQVELFQPQHEDFYRLCLMSGAAKPSFYLTEIRTVMLEAFKELARNDEIDAIVVGLELNTYAQLSKEVSYNREWDYLNLVTLYQEIYRTIKDQNDAVKVGPSVSWPSLKLDTIPQIANEFATDPQSLLTLELALRRTVWPLLWDGTSASADFIGVAFPARTAELPYQGTPLPENESAVLEFYRELPQLGAHPELAEALPIAITSIDWSTENAASGGLKTDYLIGLKKALSRTSFEWVAWQRLSMIPETPPETSACRSVMNRGYGKDTCYAGLLDVNGQPRSIWEEFVKDPE